MYIDSDTFASSNGSPSLVKEKSEDYLKISSSLSFTNNSTKTAVYSPTTPFLKFIETLNLLDKYPQKLQLVDALTIRTELLNANKIPNGVHLLPYLILQKIMMHDNYRTLCKDMSRDKFDIHPVDILLALLHCCDDILRQDLLSRLHTCKLAVPLLLPDPNIESATLLLWAMRSIVCEWKCKVGTSKEKRIVDYKGPIVSFLRVGSAKSPKDFSKSRILNMVIGEENYFFHWNCPGGKFTRKFVNGLVELSCYFPSGKDTDGFSDAVIFLNLRGETRNHTIQLDFIKKISFMTFVVLLEENLDDGVIEMMQELAILPGGLVIIFPNYEYAYKSQSSNRLFKLISEKVIAKYDLKDENEDEIKSHIQKMISTKIGSANFSQFIAISECAAIAQKIGIRVDEDNAECREGKILANDMMQILNRLPATEAKVQMLPLQGPDLWHKWAKHDKENFQKPNKENVTVAYFNQSVEVKKKEVRMKQRHRMGELTPLINYFINILLSDKPLVRIYVLQWLKLSLDDRSRKILPAIRAEHEQTRAELQKFEKGCSLENSVMKNLTNELRKKNKALIEGSLGLEHFFREVGQMYEAIKHHTNQQHVVDCYPRIMVEILNQGYPVELMDGDASHVPVTWILAVLDQLKSLYERKSLFVISVLGIQSTGKSTLLNTMFGLQFNVSAGRCTRGAYMQLLPVKHNEVLSQKSMCDYVLIIDTEGLRAPELSFTDTYLHDNELATFVIGLADVALINIYGESPGDLNDILQTAVHAFIRMKNVSVNLSCHFVHQNVAAVSDSKIKFGQQTFQDKLDEMTKYAAIAEHCETKYSKFQDVIKFDGSTDVTYFPGLWKGDPPMAPVSPGYSEKALLLKSTLMSLAHAKMKKDASFNNFQLLLKTLWTAVCCENYIFSFKNTKEIIAYNELDAEFSQWSWTLHRKMLEWQHLTGNTVKNHPSSEVPAALAMCLRKADNILDDTYIKLAEKMKHFFENSELSDTLEQWKHRYTTRLQNLKEDCKREAKKHCEVLKLSRECRTKLESIKKQYRQQLLEHIQQLVAEAKQGNRQLTDSELEKKFDEKWQLWIKEFSCEEYQSMYASDHEIAIKIGEVLHELLTKDDNILTPKLSKLDLSQKRKCDLHITINANRHLQYMPITTNRIKKLFFGKDKNEQDNSVKHLQKRSNKFFTDAADAFYKIKRNFYNFDKSYVYNLLKEFIDAIQSYNKENEYMLTSEYVVDMALQFATNMAAEFINLMDEVRTANDPLVSLKRLRETYLCTFLVQYKNVAGDDTAASSLCQLLLVAIEEAVIQILPTKIVVHMKESDPSFCQKTFFKVKVLKDLAEVKRFDLFTMYLTDIKSSFVSWAECYVEDFCTANNKKNLVILARSIVHEIIVKINTTVIDLDKNMPITQWLQIFHQRLHETLAINLCEMQDLIEATCIKDTSKHFVKALTTQLAQQEENIIAKIVSPAVDSKFSQITKWINSPHIILCESLVGCTAQCPFCKEQCELTDPNHVECGKDHFIHIHRPECLGKYTWDNTKQLVLDLCTYLVVSKNNFRNVDTNNQWVPFKNYRSLYKNWCISNESPTEAPKYWQWFISHYLKDIIKWAGAAPTSIGHLNWKAVSQRMAVDSLSEVYKIS